MAAPRAPFVNRVDQLQEIVEVVRSEGAFCFDLETRGSVHGHSDVLEQIEREWEVKKQKLKTDIPSVIERSKQAIIDKRNDKMGLDEFRNEVFWLGIATTGRSWAIPMGHANGEVLVKEVRGDGTTVPPPGYRNLTASGKESKAKAKFHIPAVFTEPPPQLTQDEVFTALEPIFMDAGIIKVNQTISFDAKSIAKYFGGVLPAGDYIDTQSLQHVLDENLKEYNLEAILRNQFKYNPYSVYGKLGSTIQHEPFSRACLYVHMDVRWAWLAYKKMIRLVSSNPSLYRAFQYDFNATRPVSQMEYNGIHINNVERIKSGQKLELELNNCMRDMLPHVPAGFNPASVADKKKLLFDPKEEGGLGLTPIRVSKKTQEPSVDQETLEAFKGKAPIIDYLLTYGELNKLKGTYIDGLDDLLYRGEGKGLNLLHPSLNLARTVTGRLSCSEPNLQNVSRESHIRNMYVPAPGYSFIVADYSQIEPRIYAAYSQDPELLRVYHEGLDLYSTTAELILGRPHETSEERTVRGKTPWLALGFGGTGHRIYAMSNGLITPQEGDDIAKKYWETFSGLAEWKKRVTREAKRLGYCETLGGRRRRLPDIQADTSTKEGWKAFSRAERQLHNMYTQGTSAEICKEAIAKVDKLMDNRKYKLHLQVHDELIVSVPTDEVDDWIPAIKEAMGHGRIIQIGDGEGVPLIVEAHAGQSWSEAK